ncbi:Asparagine synthetase domain-containing protein C4F6.11c [Trametes pubescens]|uniref:Asparagine synthetase domain-containing protein C4F6.11c n=1 Tax=Trametes pubescens TaxID=154538 RepID=A0A1M2VYJ0_TRAPU|nr:Asparagine synthetase domain-containing protein C4F6.11c [Trametes pubescens]
MCGILFLLCAANADHGTLETLRELFPKLQEAICSRGPDAQDTICYDMLQAKLTFSASELRLRGDAFIKQPHTDEKGNILCWNGEIFEGIEVRADENDGAKLLEALQGAEHQQDVVNVFGRIEGPHVAPDEPIDLLNVAFENPRKIAVRVDGNVGGLPKREKKQKLREPLDYSTVKVSFDVPDRLTGLQELEELRRLCPNRTWNFLEINVPFDESQNARPIVEALMFPSRTVMDMSLAIALYFAARAEGQIRTHPGAEPTPYTSPARVLLNGLGSDELLGGYGRHRTAFKAAGWQAVIDELQLEIDRIPTRNLGRDDRVISSWGKETRHPFLSLSVVNFLAQLPVHMKMDPRLESGLGEKLLLRLAARKVGLVEASSRKKRAMQFGSHSARMAPGEGDKKGDILIET